MSKNLTKEQKTIVLNNLERNFRERFKGDILELCKRLVFRGLNEAEKELKAISSKKEEKKDGQDKS